MSGQGLAVDLQTKQTPAMSSRTRGFVPCRTIVLVGLMGAGKTKIGRRLAARLALPFCDSDNEIEAVAGETIEEIFRNRGEAVFRNGERRVIARLASALSCRRPRNRSAASSSDCTPRERRLTPASR